jgi:hypothetical protein
MDRRETEVFVGAGRAHVRRAFPLILIFALAAVVYFQHGFEGGISRDNAIYLYSGQKMAEGVPPYVSIFDHKGPLAPMIVGAGVVISRFFSTADISTVRVLFFVIGCLAVASAYLLGGHLFRSQRAGLFAALTFLGLFGFARYAVSAPEAKTPMVLFEVLSLLFASQRRWFLAGLCGSLAFLVWQPMAVFVLVPLFLAATQKERPKLRAVSRVASGAGLPVAVTAAYFYINGAFEELVNGSILFNARFLDREQFLTREEFFGPFRAVFQGYSTILVPVVVGAMLASAIIGLATLIWLHLFGRPSRGSFRDIVTGGAFAPILLSLPFPVLWSLVDFQGYPDFYVFIPYVAVGFGGFLSFLVGRAGGEEAGGILGGLPGGVPGGMRGLLTAGLCVVLIAVAVVGSLVVVDPAKGVSSLSEEDRPVDQRDLDYQMRAASQIQERFGKDAKVISIGAPQLLVLLHKTNPSPYAFVVRGIDCEIAVQTPGGFEGWLRQLRAYDPDVIAVGQTSGRYTPVLVDWLNSRYRMEEIGPWTLYVKDGRPRHEETAAREAAARAAVYEARISGEPVEGCATIEE